MSESQTVETSSTPEAPASPSSVSVWKSNAVHSGVTLPSGTTVSIKLPNLGQLIKSGQVPNALIEVALEQINSRGAPVELDQVKQYAEYQTWLVSITVVEPKVTPEDVGELPPEDIDMIVEFATRTRDMDAVYKHFAGLEKVSTFRRFRQLDDRT